jgi:hypothetical protein
MSFLTNSESKKPGKRLSELIQMSEELKFLVGYFYFTAIHLNHNSFIHKEQ